MAKSPTAKRKKNDIYWVEKPKPGDTKNASASARIKFYLYGSGRTGELKLDQARKLGEEIVPFISSVTIEEDEEMTSKLTLSMQSLGNQISSKAIINEGDVCTLQIGYGTQFFDLNQRFTFIRSHPHFSRDGIPTIQYIGYDGRFAMVSGDFVWKKRVKTLYSLAGGSRSGASKPPSVFKNQRDDQIIDNIAYHYGFSIDVDATKGRRTRVKKKKTSNWEFIRKIAKKNDYTAWVDYDESNKTYCIHYRKKETKYTVGYVFHYGVPNPKEIKSIEKLSGANQTTIGTLLEFHPTIDTTRQMTDVEVLHFERRERYFETQWLKYPDRSLPPPPPDKDNFNFSNLDQDQYIGALLKFKVGGRQIETFSGRPFKNKKQAKEFVLYLVNEHQADFMTARGTIIGTIDVRPRQVHRLTGVGKYSGDYYFTQVTHHFRSDGFYETEFVAYRLPEQTIDALVRRGQLTQKWKSGDVVTGD